MNLGDLLRERRVIVTCGAGGVGKTTTAAAIALEAARQGRRTLVLTVDPSLRLAQALGVSLEAREPVRPPGLGDTPLDVWLLDPRGVTERVIRDVVHDPAVREALFANRLYRELSTMMAGMIEYTALEALHGFVHDARYDLVVLDTPPSRHALDILEGPRRLAAFLDGRIFQLFLPSETGASALRSGAARVLRSVLGRAFGEAEYDELTHFFDAFAGVLRACGTHTARLEALLADATTTSFVLVTAPTVAAREELSFVARSLAASRMHFAGIVLTRCDAATPARAATETELATLPPEVARALHEAAHDERARLEDERVALRALEAEAGTGAFLCAVPTFPGGIDTVDDLARVGAFLGRAGAR
jgi:anion-transporting  ArsA/GET3 family ATPase